MIPPIPAKFPRPQMQSVGYSSPVETDFVPVLSGPIRARRRHRSGPEVFSFEIWFPEATLAQEFEDWITNVREAYDGEFWIPYLHPARVMAFDQPHTWQPLGLGWRLTATVIALRKDVALCEAFLLGTYGNIWIDNNTQPDVWEADLAAADQYVDDWPPEILAQVHC